MCNPKHIDLKQVLIYTWKNREQLGALVAFGEANGPKGMGISSKIHAFWTF